MITSRALRLDPKTWGTLAERLNPGGQVLLWAGGHDPDLPPELVSSHLSLVQARGPLHEIVLDVAPPVGARHPHVLADRQRPVEDVLVRLHDLMAGRPGVAFLSISFPDGTFRGAQLMPDGHIEVQESTVAPAQARWFTVEAGALRPARTAQRTASV